MMSDRCADALHDSVQGINETGLHLQARFQWGGKGISGISY
jgi:hypothetical protein